MPMSAPWKVIHMTRSQAHAAQITQALEAEGILSRSRRVYKKVASEDNYYEIVVLDAEAREAQQILIERNLLL